MPDTRANAKGKWREVLTHYGLEPKYLKKTHGPCPMCGGTDRYRFDDRLGNGDYYCSGCGAGNGFHLMMFLLNTNSFSEAAKAVDKIVSDIRAQPFSEEVDVEQRRSIMNKVWGEANADEMVLAYLKSRGLNPAYLGPLLTDIRGSNRILHGPTGDRCRGMLALIRDPAGEPISIHRTYSHNSKRKKRVMPPTKTIAGGAIRLGEPNGELIVAEGIETALSASEMYGGTASWAAISADNMTKIVIPGAVERVLIVADNDQSFAGQKAAFVLANRLGIQEKKKVRVVMPRQMGTDMNDVIKNRLERGLLEWWNDY